MAAKKGGRRYPLVVFTHMMSRWSTAVFALGLSMIGLAWVLRSWVFEEWRWMTFAILGGFTAVAGIGMWLARKSALCSTIQRSLTTGHTVPTLNISYKRFRRTSTATMGALFPPKNVSNTLQDIVEPIAKMTAIVIEVNAMPMSQSALRLFLSQLYFKDKSPHIVILVSDWMRFSAEMDSMRHGGEVATPEHRRDISILSKLPKK